jgi:hypothetical protein
VNKENRFAFTVFLKKLINAGGKRTLDKLSSGGLARL